MSALESLPQVHLKPRRALPFFSHHPWVFAGAIRRVEGAPAPGDEVVLRADDGKFVARGLFNPDSNIRVRLYSWNPDVAIDEALLSERLDRAIALRDKLFASSSGPRACRLVYSEGDGLSGLTIDQYGEHLLVQWTSRALAARQNVILDLLNKKLQPTGIWVRTERGIGELEGLELVDGLAAGTAPPRPLFIHDGGLQFGVDVVEGQKTGFYFDQRDNRVAAARYASNGDVLDICCYSGGFSIAAAKLGGATSVLGIDSSEPALEMARRNAELNGVDDRVRFEAADQFDALEDLRESGQQFDLVVLDPPKMARTRGGLQRAARGYVRLNKAAMAVVKPGGVLTTCSCSGLISRSDFEEIVAKAALEAGRTVQILESRIQAPDHPVNIHCLESLYLKCLICRVV